MRIGLFTDTYFPQVSGVATSIRTLKTQLEKMGHTVFIFMKTGRLFVFLVCPSLLLRIVEWLIVAFLRL